MKGDTAIRATSKSDSTRTRTRACPTVVVASLHMMYLVGMPGFVPPGFVLVHNHVRPTRRLGSWGFRAWLSARGTTGLELCHCGWAPELGRHYRVWRNWRIRVTEDEGSGT